MGLHGHTSGVSKGRSRGHLVDSVINSGRSMLNLASHVRLLASDARITIVAGVVQKKFFTGLRLDERRELLVALRVSENKFSGSQGTDTGNRLFNMFNTTWACLVRCFSCVVLSERSGYLSKLFMICLIRVRLVFFIFLYFFFRVHGKSYPIMVVILFSQSGLDS